MIVHRKMPFRLVFTEIGRPLAAVLLLSLFAVLVVAPFEPPWLTFNASTLALLGSVIGIFLGFRNNQAYNRYWEARTLWGTLINTSRTLARQVMSMPEGEAGAVAAWQRGVLETQLAFVDALRARLRDENLQQVLCRHLTGENLRACLAAANPPAHLLHTLGGRVQEARHRGWISEHRAVALDATVSTLTDVLGGCEKIRNTPLPRGYTYLSHRLILALCLLLPFGLVGDLGVVTPVAATLIAFAFLVLDRNGSDVETPFGTHDNDLPLMALSRSIEIDIRQRLGDPAPMSLLPVKGVLL